MTRSTERAESQRERVIAAATDIFSRRGYRGTSMNEIAAEVGLRKPTLYHYFTSKEQLLVRLYEEVMAESLEGARAIISAAATPLDALRELFTSRVAYTCERRRLLTVAFEEENALPGELLTTVLQQRREFEALVRDTVEHHLERSGVTLPGSPTVYVNTCLGAVNWIYKWYDPEGPKTPQQLGAEMAAILLAPLQPADRTAGEPARQAS